MEVLVPSKRFNSTVLGSSILKADSPQNSKSRSGRSNDVDAHESRKLQPSVLQA